MLPEGYADVLRVAEAVTAESEGRFLAMGAMEWNTTSAGNHVNIFGSRELAQTRRGEYHVLYEEFLRDRAWEGDLPFVMLNHPRTFRNFEGSLNGSWDQVFDVSLADISREGERRAKFNDYGLDDYSPLRDVRDEWLAGTAMPDRQVIDETMARLREATAPTVRLMEVTVGRGSDIGHEGGQNPSLNVDEAGETVRYTHVHDDFDHYLLQGFRIAPVASHDNHYANWGSGHSSRTAIFAEALTEDALLQAIDVRAVVASEDENLDVRFFADDRVLMGQRTATIESEVAGRVFVTDPDYDGPFVVRLYAGRVHGEEVVMVTETELARSGWLDLVLPTAEPGEHFFYVEVWEAGPNRMAWTAPIWLTRL
jgi:hypothetical protein